MKIKYIRPYIKEMPLTKPYTIAYSTMSDVALVFLEIELENGIIGMGSASPAESVVGENPQQTLQNLETHFVQELIGRDIRHFRQIIFEATRHFTHLPGTIAAIDIALHDAFAKYLGISVVDFYGRKIKSLPTSVTIGIMNPSQTLEEAENYYQLGFKILKVKTGLNIEEDIERILLLQERFKNNMIIRVDANQGYSKEDLQKFIKATNKKPVELIEQPVPVGKESLISSLGTEVTRYIAGDESIKDASAALAFCAVPKPFGIFNIKLMKCGGLLGAFSIADIALNGGIELFWGCNDESLLGITAALHAAYACSNTRYIDLDGSFDLAEDLVTGGFSLSDGYMLINDQPGFGTHKIIS